MTDYIPHIVGGVVALLVAWLVAAAAREWWHRPVTEQLEHIASLLRHYGERQER